MQRLQHQDRLRKVRCRRYTEEPFRANGRIHRFDVSVIRPRPRSRPANGTRLSARSVPERRDSNPRQSRSSRPRRICRCRPTDRRRHRQRHECVARRRPPPASIRRPHGPRSPAPSFSPSSRIAQSIPPNAERHDSRRTPRPTVFRVARAGAVRSAPPPRAGRPEPSADVRSTGSGPSQRL